MGYICSDIPNTVGFCNRLFKWGVMHLLASTSGPTVLVDWPEFRELELPLTEFGTPDHTFLPLDTRTLQQPRVNQGDYLCVCGWDFHGFGIQPEWSPLREVRLSDESAQRMIRSSLAGWVGVHVRRGDFAPANDLANGFEVNTRIPDDWYLELIERIRNALPDARFYLATDGTEEEQAAFRALPGLHGRELFDTTVDPKLVDLFALSSCGLIVGSNSTYSLAAARMTGVPLIWPTDGHQPLDEEHFRLLKQLRGLSEGCRLLGRGSG
ncbi:MAG: hypothetical protein U1E22_05425 [Coriobacteriia bacterium]|nr:hypothetical protein [Coriobacteriia bacterium]